MIIADSATCDVACQQLWPWIFEAFVREIGLSGLSRSPGGLSILRLRLYIDSLTNAKNYLDTFLTIPLDRLASLPSAQWALLNYCILFVAAVSLLSTHDAPEWTVDAAHSIINFDSYLDAVCLRVRELADQMYPVESLSDWYGSLLMRWDAIKARYLTALREQRVGQDAGNGNGNEHAQDPQSLQQPPPQQDMDGGQQQQWLELSQYPMADGAFVPMAGFELLDFANNVGSWMLPNADPVAQGQVPMQMQMSMPLPMPIAY